MGYERCLNFEYMHRAEKERNTTLDNEKYSSQHNSVVITLTRSATYRQTVCENMLHMEHQPKACALDLVDNKSPYLFGSLQTVGWAVNFESGLWGPSVLR